MRPTFILSTCLVSLLVLTGCIPSTPPQPAATQMSVGTQAPLPKPSPSNIPTLPVPTESPTVMPTDVPTVSPTVPPLAPAEKLVFVDVKSSPTRSVFRVINADTGETQATFSIDGLDPRQKMLAVEDKVFYLDVSANVIKMATTVTNRPLEFTRSPEADTSDAFLPFPDATRLAWTQTNWVKDNQSNSQDLHVLMQAAAVADGNPSTLVDETRSTPSRPEPIHWSNDGKSLYFTNAPYGIGGNILFFGVTNLNRIDLSTKQVTPILPQKNCLCSTVLSPDETQVAYISRPEGDTVDLIIQDLATGDKKKTSLPAGYRQAGAILWSPDGKSLVLTAATGDPTNELSTVLQYDTTRLQPVTLVPDTPGVLNAITWTGTGTIWLSRYDGGVWQYDLANSELKQVSETERALPSQP